jgi:two-component system response regulator HydG
LAGRFARAILSAARMDGETAFARVMVVEDDDDVARAVARRLGADGHEVELASEAHSVLARLDAGLADWDVVLLDVGLPDTSGIDVLKRFHASGAPCSVIMLTGDRSAQTATACMRAGAFYYLTKPFEPYELSATVESAARHARMRRELASVHGGQSASLLIGASHAIRKLRAAVERLAQQDVSILIQGESGTGKELVARALHERGARRGRRFVALNCGAIPESLIDSELFGHVKGAFTGATADRPGVFVEADGGTLFLDEIGDMPQPVQARLLRVLQDSEVRAVGGSSLRTVNVRVIASSNVELAAAVQQQRFREDLFYRLNVVALRVPALRERDGDVPLLAAHFLKKHGGDEPPALAPDALDALAAYPWPGNVRELENALLHALAMYHGEAIGADVLPHTVGNRAGGGVAGGNEAFVPLTEAKRRASAEFEKRYLVRVMEHAKGSVSEAARLSGLDRANFRRLLQRHAIDPARFK